MGRLLGGDPGRPRARLWDGEVGSQEEDREGSQDARSSAHGPRRADTHPPVFSALPQPRRPLAPRAGQDEGLGMVGTHSQVGCSPPQTGSPCCVRCPPGARGEAGCHRLCPPRLPFSLSRLRVSPRHRLQVGSPASLWVRLSLHLLLFSVLLPPPLLSLSLSVACSVSPSPPQGLLPWTFPGQPSPKPHKRSTLVASEPRSEPHAWDQRRPGDGCGPGAGWVGASLWGLQEAESSRPLPCHPPSGLGETSAEVCISSVASSAPGAPGSSLPEPPRNVWRDGLGSPGDRRAQDGSELSKPRRPPNLLLLSSRTCFVHFRNPGPPEVCLEVGSAAPPARPLGLLGKALGLWSRGAAQGQR